MATISSAGFTWETSFAPGSRADAQAAVDALSAEARRSRLGQEAVAALTACDYAHALQCAEAAAREEAEAALNELSQLALVTSYGRQAMLAFKAKDYATCVSCCHAAEEKASPERWL